jgi:hypothetical protein
LWKNYGKEVKNMENRPCIVGCNNLRIALILDGAKNKAGFGPIRDAVVAECCAVQPAVEIYRFEGLTPDGDPKSFQCNRGFYLLEESTAESCIEPDEREIDEETYDRFKTEADINDLITEVRK